MQVAVNQPTNSFAFNDFILFNNILGSNNVKLECDNLVSLLYPKAQVQP